MPMRSQKTFWCWNQSRYSPSERWRRRPCRRWSLGGMLWKPFAKMSLQRKKNPGPRKMDVMRSNADWMGELSEYLLNVPLNQIALPGTLILPHWLTLSRHSWQWDVLLEQFLWLCSWRTTFLTQELVFRRFVHYTVVSIVFQRFVPSSKASSPLTNERLKHKGKTRTFWYLSASRNQRLQGQQAWPLSDLRSRHFNCLKTHTKFSAAAKPIVIGWSITQSRTVKQQLKDGVRYLDFRVAPDSKETLYLVHGLFGPQVNFTFFVSC